MLTAFNIIQYRNGGTVPVVASALALMTPKSGPFLTTVEQTVRSAILPRASFTDLTNYGGRKEKKSSAFVS